MLTLHLTINELFAVQDILSKVNAAVAKTPAGDTCAYRVARNIATVSPIIESSRTAYMKQIDDRLKAENIDPSNEAEVTRIRQEIAQLLGSEKEEVKLRVLPAAGVAWASIPDAVRFGLLSLGLVDDPEDPIPAPAPAPAPENAAPVPV